MASIGDLYAPEDNFAAYVTNAVVAYTGLVVDRPAYKHFVDNKLEPFLKIFPHGKVPAFKAKNGFVLFEGAVLAKYFASLVPGSGLLLQDLEQQALVDQWSHLIDTEVYNAALNNWLVYMNILRPSSQELSDSFKAREEGAYNTINKHLEGRQYLVGDSLTFADIHLAAVIRFTICFTFARAEREKYANIFNHFERLAKVPSLEKVLGGATYAEEAIKYTPKA